MLPTQGGNSGQFAGKMKAALLEKGGNSTTVLSNDLVPYFAPHVGEVALIVLILFRGIFTVLPTQGGNSS